MSVLGYARVSTTDQALGASLEEQERRIRGVAMMRGVEVTRLFREPGISGSVPLEDRPAGRELLSALRPGDTLVVAKLDRAFRNAADALTRADAWRKKGIHLIVADMGSEPVTGNGVAKMFFGLLALVAEFERDRILERTNEGRRSKAEKGGHIGGSAPFGYRIAGSGRDAQLIEVPEQQAAIQTIRSLRGKASLRQVADQVWATHGIRISHEAVRRILEKGSKVPSITRNQ